MTREHREMLLRIHEDLMKQAHAQGRWNWSRWHFLLVINTGLAASAATILEGGGADAPAILLAEAILGIVAAWVWARAAKHGAFCYRMREYQAREIEKLLGDPFASFGVFSRGGHIIEKARDGESTRFLFEEEDERRLKLPYLFEVSKHKFWSVMHEPARYFTNTLPLVFLLLWIALLIWSSWHIHPCLALVLIGAVAVSVYKGRS